MGLARVGRSAAVNLRHVLAVRVDEGGATCYFPGSDEVQFTNESGEWYDFLASLPEAAGASARPVPKHAQGGPDVVADDLSASS